MFYEERMPPGETINSLITDIDRRNESLAVSIRRCQDAIAITMYGLSKSFQIFKIISDI